MPALKNVLRVSSLCFVILAACHHRAKIATAVAPAAQTPVVVPAGSTLAFRTAELIDSDKPIANRAFAAVINRDVNGAVVQDVLPSGSPASMILLPSAGAPGSWELALVSVTLNGDSFLVRNQGALGTEGGDSARLGTFLGGVSGTVYGLANSPVVTSPPALSVSGSKIWIPSGSLLTFRLDQGILLISSVKRPVT